MNRRLSIGVALTIALFALGLAATRTPAKTRMEEFLTGKWHQEYGPYVTETVLNGDGTFISETIQRGAPYRLYVEGRWSVRYENQLWMEWDNWEPHTINKPLPEGTMFQVIDQDHFRNKLGVATRVRW
jgi:hypothetical protein